MKPNQFVFGLAAFTVIAVASDLGFAAPSTQFDCEGIVTSLPTTSDAVAVFAASSAFASNASSVIEHLQHARSQADSIPRLRHALVTLLDGRGHLRAFVEQKITARSLEFEETLRRRIRNAPMGVRIHLDSWEKAAENLEADVAAGLEKITYPLRAFDRIHNELEALARRLQAEDSLPAEYLFHNEAPFDSKTAASRLNSETLTLRWAEATDPIHGASPNRSRHFVLGINRDPLENVTRCLARIEAALRGIVIDTDAPSNFLADPERIADKSLLSISYVGPGARQTYQNAGLIVEVPPENILTTYFADAGSPTYAKLGEPERLLAARRILSPDELLAYGYNYNEINVVGTHPTTNRRVRAIGVFLRADQDHRPLVSAEEVRWWTDYARAHHWPAPELISDAPSADQTARSALTYWKAAGDLERQAAVKPFPDLRAWNSEISNAMRLQGNQSTDARRTILKSLQIVEVADGLYRLRRIGRAPDLLKWPADDMISFYDYLASTNDPLLEMLKPPTSRLNILLDR